MYKNSDYSCSINYKNIGIPLLVQPKFLRRLGASQLDYAYFEKDILYLIEAKSSEKYPAYKQVVRLRRSASVLSEIFSKSVVINLFIEQNKSVFKL